MQCTSSMKFLPVYMSLTTIGMLGVDKRTAQHTTPGHGDKRTARTSQHSAPTSWHSTHSTQRSAQHKSSAPHSASLAYLLRQDNLYRSLL